MGFQTLLSHRYLLYVCLKCIKSPLLQHSSCRNRYHSFWITMILLIISHHARDSTSLSLLCCLYTEPKSRSSWAKNALFASDLLQGLRVSITILVFIISVKTQMALQLVGLFISCAMSKGLICTDLWSPISIKPIKRCIHLFQKGKKQKQETKPPHIRLHNCVT